MSTAPRHRAGCHIDQPLVDGRGARLLEQWAYALADLAWKLQQAEAGAVYGNGQQEIRTRQRGGDPVCGRLDWDADGERPPVIADAELEQLRKLRDGALGRLDYDLAWLQRELWPRPANQQQQQPA